MEENGKITRFPGADQPARRDELHLDAYITGLTEFIRTCRTPMTISLQGSWGSGKSSMMNLLEKGLSGSAVCVTFNTWQYSQFDLGPRLPLLFYQSLIEKLGAPSQTAEKQESKDQRLAQALKKGLTRLGWVAARRAGVDDVAEAAVAAAKDVRAAWKGEDRSPEKPAPATLTDAVEGLRESFQELVNARCDQEGKERAVFFIDDLDRLPPARAVELMEVLKTAVECENCVFVLAIDYEVVLRGVRDKYGADFGAEKGRSFFDKMIQLPFDLPVEQYRMEDFLEEQVRSIGDPDCVAALLGRSATGGTAEIHEVKDDVMESSHPEDRTYVRDMALLAAGHNPRSLKRLFNAFTLTVRVVRDFEEKTFGRREVTHAQWVLLFGVAALRSAYPKVYDRLMAVCHNGVELGEFYRWFHFDEDWERLQTRQAAVAQSLGLAGLSDLETDRVRTLVRRFFHCSLLEEETLTNCLPKEETGSIQEQWLAVRDGLPFPVRKWQTLERVLEMGAASDWAKGKAQMVQPEERFKVLAALLRTIEIRWSAERWNELTPARMERCIELLCDNLRDGDQTFTAFFDRETEDVPGLLEPDQEEYIKAVAADCMGDHGPLEEYNRTHKRLRKVEGYRVESCDYAYSAVWEMLYCPDRKLFPRDVRLLAERIRRGGETAEEDMDTLAALLEKVFGVAEDTDKPFDTPEARRRALTCLEPGW